MYLHAAVLEPVLEPRLLRQLILFSWWATILCPNQHHTSHLRRQRCSGDYSSGRGSFGWLAERARLAAGLSICLVANN